MGVNLKTEPYLRGIVAKDTINYNDFLTFRKPSLGPEPGLGLRRGRRHAEECRESNEQSNKTPVNRDVSSLRRAERQSYSLDEEQPSVGRSLAYCVVTCQDISYLHPARSRTPLIRKTPNAMKLAAMLHTFDDIQKRARRIGSSFLV